MKKYIVTREETWSWTEEFEAESAEELMNILDNHDWELPSDAHFTDNNYWIEVENENS